MKSSPWLLCGFLGCLAASCGFLFAQAQTDKGPPNPKKGVQQVRAGMTPAEVRNLMGAPVRTARQILHRRYLEQWSYENPDLVWIEFNCIKGQEPYVLAVHAFGAAKPGP
jgi:hypothetical protein